MKGLGIIIKELRKEKNCTQKTLAEALGVTQDSISLWETDKRIPDTAYIVAMAKFFEVSTDYLLGLSEDYRWVSVGENNRQTFVNLREMELIYNYRKLSDKNKELLTEYLKLLNR